MFVPFDAAQYRGLDHDEFVARRSEVIDLMNAEVLPEGVTDEMLYAEADLIEAEATRRARVNQLRRSNIEAVVSGEGTVIASSEEATTEEVRAMPRAEHTFEARNRETSQNYTDTAEYREAFAKHVLRQQQMPRDMVVKAVMEKRAAGDPVPVDFADAFTNMTDPTWSNTISSLVVAPSTLSDQVQREMRESSVLFPRVNQTTYQGQYAVSELDLVITGSWIGDKEVSPYQDDYDPEVFTWGWHQFEARHARTFLAQAIMDARYDQLAVALGECFGNAADAAIYAGNGTTQPRGITNDLRLVGSDGLGIDSALTTWYTQRTGTGKGRALIVTVSPEQVDDWKFWVSLLYNEKFNRLYRGRGELVIADGTWGNHIALIHDDNNRPIGLDNPFAEEHTLSIRGVGNVVTMPNSLMKTFDTASNGDIIGIYGNLRNYTVNTQPGMPLSTVSWDDHETNTHKTKMLVAMDGRIHDPFGWIILKKGPSA